MSLIKENNRQYYEGAQGFRFNSSDQDEFLTSTPWTLTTTFNTDLEFYGYKLDVNEKYPLNNFKLYSSLTAAPGSWTEYTDAYTISGNTITLGIVTSSVNSSPSSPNNYVDVATDSLTSNVEVGALILMPDATWTSGMSGNDGWAFASTVVDQGNNVTRITWSGQGYGNASYNPSTSVTIINYVKEQSRPTTFFVVQLKKLDGGEYGATLPEKAYGDEVEKNYGSYAYTKLNDVINNFLVAYVGAGKLIPSVKRTDVIFHAKRAMQEFSYDTLKSVNKLEVSVPHNLSIPMPQDYVNYVNLYWIDNSGVKRVIMPGNMLTTNPTDLFLQDTKGVPVQNQFNNNIDTTSVTEDRWENNILKQRTNSDFVDDTILGWEYYYGWPEFGYGQLYGLDPQFANSSGYYTINERENKFSFSANLVDKIVVIEYISDGLSTDLDTRIPKLAEEALYAYLKHAILASRINQPEYIIQRLKREASAQLRNAKIRLSNIKLDQIVQVMRGKSKQIKH
jgi:hypothetical protein